MPHSVISSAVLRSAVIGYLVRFATEVNKVTADSGTEVDVVHMCLTLVSVSLGLGMEFIVLAANVVFADSVQKFVG